MVYINSNNIFKQQRDIFFDKNIGWKCIEYIQNQLYIPNNKNYTNKRLVNYFIARNTKQGLKSKL